MSLFLEIIEEYSRNGCVLFKVLFVLWFVGVDLRVFLRKVGCLCEFVVVVVVGKVGMFESEIVVVCWVYVVSLGVMFSGVISNVDELVYICYVVSNFNYNFNVLNCINFGRVWVYKKRCEEGDYFFIDIWIVCIIVIFFVF